MKMEFVMRTGVEEEDQVQDASETTQIHGRIHQLASDLDQL